MIIGITGGIGSGKSTLTDIIEKLNYKVIDTDIIAKNIFYSKNIYFKIKYHFKNINIFDKDKNINRYLLREYIINHKTDRIWLESLLHPLIKKTVINIINNYKHINIIFIAIPLLYNKNEYFFLNDIWTIESYEYLRIKRIQYRDKLNIQNIKKLFLIQPSKKIRCNISSVIINNNSTINRLKFTINYHLRNLHNTL
jgi:dephospho-CoA kinase